MNGCAEVIAAASVFRVDSASTLLNSRAVSFFPVLILHAAASAATTSPAALIVTFKVTSALRPNRISSTGYCGFTSLTTRRAGPIAVIDVMRRVDPSITYPSLWASRITSSAFSHGTL